MRVYRVRRAPNPRGLRSDPTLWLVASLSVLAVAALAAWAVLGLWLLPLAAAVSAGLIYRAWTLDRRDAAERGAAARNATEIEETR
jgi:4-hydroxybenzoate polyprenyltransferase